MKIKRKNKTLAHASQLTIVEKLFPIKLNAYQPTPPSSQQPAARSAHL
jgi:hypothetical protein